MDFKTLFQTAPFTSERLEYPSAWLGHIPFAHWLGLELKPRVFVELGAHYGHSYFNLCRGIVAGGETSACFAVDTWEGDGHAGLYGEEVYEGVQAHNREHYGEISTLLRMTFQEAVRQFEDGGIDLLHIDGLHTYEAVQKDFETWRPKLSEKAVVLLHDVAVKEKDFGVWRFWEELKQDFPFHLEFPHCNGLGVLAMGKTERDVPLEWLRASGEIPALLQKWFQARGDEVQRHFDLKSITEEHRRLQHQLHEQALAQTTASEAYSRRESAWLDRETRMDRKILTLRRERGDCDARIQELETGVRENQAVISRLSAASRRAHGQLTRFHMSTWLPAFSILLQFEQRFPRISRWLGLPAKCLGWMVRGGLTNNLRVRREAEEVMASGFFDPTWYLEQNPDLASALLHPVFHWLAIGWKELRNPGPDFDLAAYRRSNPDVVHAGVNPLLHFLRHGKQEGRGAVQPPETAAAPPAPCCQTEPQYPLEALNILHNAFPQDKPFSVFEDKLEGPRVSIVTDSVNAGSLFGGVSTAILLGTHLAKHRKASLRIVTLHEKAHPENVADIQRIHAVEWSQNIDFVFLDHGQRPLPVCAEDLFLTTSWWTTRHIRQTAPPEQILYLLQEDERMFYPHGDEWLRCQETLSDTAIRYAVNSRNLFEHLQANGLNHLSSRGTWFEPAFPEHIYHPAPRGTEAKKQFLFYARPRHPRNLFYRGLECVIRLIETGVLSAEEWDITFVGSHIPPLQLPGGHRVTIIENLPWDAYAALIREMDVGLSLMLTPHPSYPPLDLAASGAVVVTNRFGPKQDLEAYSPNIFCVDVTVDSLVEGVRCAAERANRQETALCPTPVSGILRDWGTAFTPVSEWMGGV